MSFHDYIQTRCYHYGRGSKAGWDFVARALGDACLLDATTWTELRAYLERCGDNASSIRAAQVVWNSYLALLTKQRRATGVCSSPASYSDGSIVACSCAQ